MDDKKTSLDEEDISCFGLESLTFKNQGVVALILMKRSFSLGCLKDLSFYLCILGLVSLFAKWMILIPFFSVFSLPYRLNNPADEVICFFASCMHLNYHYYTN